MFAPDVIAVKSTTCDPAAEALSEIIVGWSGVDEAYSDAALNLLVDNYPAAAADLFESFRKELLEAKRKN